MSIRTVNISGNEYKYNTFWNGEIIPSEGFAFDTETECFKEDDYSYIPELALASASNSIDSYLIHPSRLSEFIILHKNHHYIFQNIAFDFWIVDKYLRQNNHTEALSIWWELVENNKTHDTLLLDMLVNLAINDSFPRPRDLGILSQQYAKLTISKEDPYRLRYSELIGKDWSKEDVELGFLEYAIKDPIVTYLVFISLYKKAKQLAREAGVNKDTLEKYGPLTEQIQIKGAIALTKTTRNGIHIDRNYSDTLKEKLTTLISTILSELLQNPTYKNIFKFNKKTNEIIWTPKGKPSLSILNFRELLVSEAKKAEQETGRKFTIPLTEKKKISTSMVEWVDLVKYSDFLQKYDKMMETANLVKFFAGLDTDIIYPKYSYLVRTGRISGYDPNITQFPKAGGFREVFTAKPGNLLLAMDYKFIELRTLAHVMEEMFGKSVLAEVIRAGRDPHEFSAAILTNMSFEEFLEKKVSNNKFYKQWRQNSKIFNFGLPGGLSAYSLIHYARCIYGVEFTYAQSKLYRDKTLNEVYPEMGKYLNSDDMELLASNLGCPVYKCWEAFDWTKEKEKYVTLPIKNIVKGEPVKKDGTPYNSSFVDRIWDNLILLNNNEVIQEQLRKRQGSFELMKILFWQNVKTTTGRIRGKVSFTQFTNSKFQGLASDGAKLMLWRLIREGYIIRIFCHDEAVIELKAEIDENKIEFISLDRINKIKRIMCEEMEKLTGKVPIDCDYVIGKKWAKDGKIEIIDNRVYPV